MVSSVALNVAGAVAGYGFVWELTQSRRHAFYAGVLSAVWFLPIFGAFYHDHLAYLLVLLAGYSYLFLKSDMARAAAPGLLLAAAYYVKQTVGATGLLAFGAAWLACGGWRFISVRGFLGLVSSYLAGHLFFLGLIAVVGDFKGYWYSNVTLPLAFAAVTSDKSPWELLFASIFPFKIQPLRMLRESGIGRMVFYPVVLGVYASYVLLFTVLTRPLRSEGRSASASFSFRFGYMFLIVSTIWCSAMLGRHFAHVTLGFGCIVAVSLYLLAGKVRWKMPSSFRPEVLVLAFYVLLGLAHIGFDRKVWEPRAKEFPRNTDLYPIMMKQGDSPYISLRPLVAAIEFLQGKSGPYAIMDDEAFLIPLALRRSPVGPTPFYADVLTVPEKAELRAEWERDFIRRIEARGVRFFVSTLGPGVREFRISGAKMMETLPRLRKYLEQEYEQVFQSGAVKVYQKKDRRGGS